MVSSRSVTVVSGDAIATGDLLIEIEKTEGEG